MAWDEGTDDWDAFIEAPAREDMDRLTEHLGLVWFDPDYGPHQRALAASLDHPGISCYGLHRVRLSHCMYQPHVRYLRPLPVEYWAFDPELFRIVIETRQTPR
jgi:hypothetical protein